MRILHVLPNLDLSGSATQLSLLVKNLAERIEQRVCVLGGPGPAPAKLPGGVVELLDWTRPINPLPLLRLRRLIHTWRPDVIHSWQMPSLRALALVGKKAPCKWIAHGSWGRLSRLDTWLLRRATRVVARSSAQADWLLANGLARENIVVVSPGVELSADTLAGGSRLNSVVCAGSLERHKGYYEAIWAVDILKYLYDDVRLDVVGDGPDRGRLEHFVKAIHAREYVRLPGSRENASQELAHAGVVWVPSLREGGVNTALKAMSLGKPVVAGAVGTLGEIIQHGETGFLVPPGDKIALARCTRLLFDDPELRERFAVAGRERARTHFSAVKMAESFRQLYADLAA